MKKANFLVSKDGKVILRAISKEDVKDVLIGVSNQEVWENLGRISKPISYEREIETIEQIQKRENSITFGIEFAEKIVGIISLRLNLRNANAEIGIWINPDHHKKGIGRTSGSLIIDFGFQNFPLHKIGWHAFDFNVGSIALAKKLGMQQVATIPQDAFKRGMFVDLVILQITRDEWAG